MKTSNVAIAGGIAALLLFFTRFGANAVAAATGALSGYGVDGALTIAQMRALAADTTARYFPGVDPAMLVRMAWVESSFRPTAFRLEAHVGDASVGLMQTLAKTAQWLWDDMGARSFPRPDATSLLDPATSVYFGAAYVDWLRRYRGEAKSEEWIVRAYNGGPGFGTTSTNNHWRKYLDAKAQWG